MKVLLLAAGKSQRLGLVTQNMPKPMVLIGSKPILQWNLELLSYHGFKDIWINLHYYPEKVIQYFDDGSKFGVRINYSMEEEIMGTAGAVKKLENIFTESFLVFYGDNFTNCDLSALVRCHLNYGGIGTIACFDQSRSLHTGITGGRIVLNRKGFIENFIEGRECNSPIINGGIYVLENRIFNYIPPNKFFDFGHDVFPLLLKNGEKLSAFLIQGYCLGIDTPETLELARNIYENYTKLTPHEI